MASCSPSANSARAFLALPLLLASVDPAAAEGRGTSCCPSKLERTAPSDPLERLRAARENQIERGPVRGPSELPTPTDAQRRRAFESLTGRKAQYDIEARARIAQGQGQAAIAAEREAAAKRIGQALGLEAPDIVAAAAAEKLPGHTTWVPVLFVSSSMPVATLRTYAAQLERVRGVLAFRGMPGGLRKVAPMAKLSAEMLRIDPGCEGPACAMRDVQVIVDPLLFRQHGVTKVPALTMLPGDPTQPYCERDDASAKGRHLVLGDAALSGLFEEYGRLGGKEEVSDAASRISGR